MTLRPWLQTGVDGGSRLENLSFDGPCLESSFGAWVYPAPWRDRDRVQQTPTSSSGIHHGSRRSSGLYLAGTPATQEDRQFLRCARQRAVPRYSGRDLKNRI